jgi:tRNA threonylcarbamoyladenosine modification (KEOPS) complex  Pcc1 subunit
LKLGLDLVYQDSLEVYVLKAMAIFNLDFSSKKQLNIVFQSLKPEIRFSSTKRSKVNISTEDKTMILVFKAKDTSALRAAINSYLRLVGVVMKLQKIAEY